MIKPQGLLFIEPTQPELATPVIDNLTRRMAAALQRSRSGTWQGDRFDVGNGWRGWHTCSCGAMSGNHDLLLANGMVTNSLAVHYLAKHRLEVPQAELRKVLTLPAEESQPTWEQLNPRKLEQWYRIGPPTKREEPLGDAPTAIAYGAPFLERLASYIRRQRG
jgi:hypothetical protein